MSAPKLKLSQYVPNKFNNRFDQTHNSLCSSFLTEVLYWIYLKTNHTGRAKKSSMNKKRSHRRGSL